MRELTGFSQVFHIVSGDKKSFELKELIDQSYSTLEEYDKEWIKKNYPKPVIASIVAFDLFIKSAEAANNPLLKGVLSALRHFAHQLTFPKQFDHSNLIKFLPDYDRELPNARNYYNRIVKYCVTTKWGKIHD